MFLTDVFIVENLQVLEEASGNKPMKIRGIFQRADEANNNKRIYPKTVLEHQMSKLQPHIDGRRLCGELDHPSNDTVKLSNASHLITKLEMKGNEVLGEAEILNTPAGLTAKALIQGGVQIGISSRGMGTLSESADGTKKVNEDFKLVTFDLVADPSTRGAYPTLSESTQYQEILKKSTEERVFIMQLQEEIDKKLRLDEKSKVKKKRDKGISNIEAIKKETEDEKELKQAEAELAKMEPKKGVRGAASKAVGLPTKIVGKVKAAKEKAIGPKGTVRRAANIGLGAAGAAASTAKGISGRFAGLTQKMAGSTGIKGAPGATGAAGGITARLRRPSRTAIAGQKPAAEREAEVAKRREEVKNKRKNLEKRKSELTDKLKQKMMTTDPPFAKKD